MNIYFVYYLSTNIYCGPKLDTDLVDFEIKSRSRSTFLRMLRHLRLLFFARQPRFYSEQQYYPVRYQATQVENRDSMGAVIEDFKSADVIPFARAKIGTFFQEVPTLGNTFKEDVHLQSYLRRVIPQNVSFHNLAKGKLEK